MNPCLFCEIAAGRVPAVKVYDDETCLAFMDIQPVNPGHVLVVPKVHAQHLENLKEGTGGHVFEAARRVAKGVRSSGVLCDAITFLLSDGEAAGQEVFHVHLHVIPRFRGDRFGLKFSPTYGEQPKHAELEELAGRIKAGL